MGYYRTCNAALVNHELPRLHRKQCNAFHPDLPCNLQPLISYVYKVRYFCYVVSYFVVVKYFCCVISYFIVSKIVSTISYIIIIHLYVTMSKRIYLFISSYLCVNKGSFLFCSVPVRRRPTRDQIWQKIHEK